MKNHSRSTRTARALLLAAWVLCLAGCALHWPWHRHPATAPMPVMEVAIASPSGAVAAAPAITQFWDRNTLLIDLTAVSAEGVVAMTPIAGRGWPVRLEFRVRPGSIGRLEVVGAEREVFVIPAQGAPLKLKLPPGVYRRDTEQINLSWFAADDLAH